VGIKGFDLLRRSTTVDGLAPVSSRHRRFPAQV
jgi:hypothetical protein